MVNNGKPSDVLACIPISGKPLEMVSYPQHFMGNSHHTRRANYVNSLTLSVKDLNDELFDFKGMPLRFELEIN